MISNFSSVTRCLLRLTLVVFAITVLSNSDVTAQENSSTSIVATSDAVSHLISEIEITGTSDLEASQILILLESRVGQPLDKVNISKDIHSIYQMGLFEDVQAEVVQEPKGNILRYQITERPRLAEIKFEGIKAVSRTEIEELMTLLQYDPYDPAKISENEQIILEFYRSEGYSGVKISHRIESINKKQFRVVFQMNEKPRVFLSRINVSGTKYYSELDIKRFIMSSEIDCVAWANQSGVFREEMINQDLSMITQRYLKNGYIKVFIQKPKVALFHNPDYSRVEVDLDISEGDQYFTGKVDVSGDILGDKVELIQGLLLQEGEVYNPFNQNQDRSIINEMYSERGYAFARVIPDTDIDEEKKIVNVTYRIQKRDKAYFGRIDIAGNAETRDHIIRREFEMNEEELFNGKKLRLSQENLNRLGFFDSGVLFERHPREEEDNVLNILARLKEGQTGTFQMQVGYSDMTGFTGGVNLSKGNLFGTGRTLRLNAQFSEQSVQQKYDITIIDPRLFDTKVSGSFFSSTSKVEDSTELERGVITENSYGMSLGMPLYFRNLRFSTQLSAMDRLFSSSSDDLYKRSVSPSLNYNSINHPVFPSEGIKSSLRFIKTGTPFGGNVRLQEYLLQYQQFWSLNQDNTFILMAKGRYSLLEKQGNSPIPTEDRYRLGGIDSIRGHSYNYIAGPFGYSEQNRNQTYRVITDENGYQQTKSYDSRTEGFSQEQYELLQSGGISERLFNLELLFPLSQDEKSFVRGVLFLDAGNVNSEAIQYQLLGETEPSFFDMRSSAGFGFRVITPMGVLRFEYGSKLDKRSGETPDRFEFTVSGLF